MTEIEEKLKALVEIIKRKAKIRNLTKNKKNTKYTIEYKDYSIIVADTYRTSKKRLDKKDKTILNLQLYKVDWLKNNSPTFIFSICFSHTDCSLQTANLHTCMYSDVENFIKQILIDLLNAKITPKELSDLIQNKKTADKLGV